MLRMLLGPIPILRKVAGSVVRIPHIQTVGVTLATRVLEEVMAGLVATDYRKIFHTEICNTLWQHLITTHGTNPNHRQYGIAAAIASQ